MSQSRVLDNCRSRSDVAKIKKVLIIKQQLLAEVQDKEVQGWEECFICVTIIVLGHSQVTSLMPAALQLLAVQSAPFLGPSYRRCSGIPGPHSGAAKLLAPRLLTLKHAPPCLGSPGTGFCGLPAHCL